MFEQRNLSMICDGDDVLLEEMRADGYPDPCSALALLMHTSENRVTDRGVVTALRSTDRLKLVCRAQLLPRTLLLALATEEAKEAANISPTDDRFSPGFGARASLKRAQIAYHQCDCDEFYHHCHDVLICAREAWFLRERMIGTDQGAQNAELAHANLQKDVLVKALQSQRNSTF